MPSGYLRGKPDVEFWLGQVRRGTDFRKKFTHEQQWNNWRDYYRGNWQSGVIPSNLYFRMVRTIVPRIYFRNPSVSVQAALPGLVPMAFAKLLEATDNKLIRQIRMKRQMKKMVQDAWLWGSAFGKVGFGAEFVPTPTFGIASEAPVGRSGEVFEYHSRVRRQIPFFMRTKTGNFVLPPNAESLEASRWAAEWVRRPLDDVKSDPTLRNVADLRGGGKNKERLSPPTGGAVNDVEDMIDLLEIRDKKMKKVFVLAPNASERVLFFDDDELQINGNLNWHMLVFNEDDDVAWGVPDAHILDPQQRELNEIRTVQMKHRRLSLVKFLVKHKGMEAEQARKLVDLTVGPVAWTNEDPNLVVRVLEAADIPSGLLTAESIVLQDVREQQGFGRNQFGEFSEGKSKRTTATEAQIVRMASEIRVDERRDMMADLLVDVIEQMHPIIFRYWTQEEVLQVAGPGGIPLWVAFRPSILREGEYEVAVDPDTSVPQTKELREAKALQLYQILSTNPLIDPIKLTQYLLHEMEGVHFSSMLRGDLAGMGGQGNPLDIAGFSQLLGAFPGQAAAALPALQGAGAGGGEE